MNSFLNTQKVQGLGLKHKNKEILLNQLEKKYNYLIEIEKQKDEFLSIVSHELKTPVTTIKAFTQLLQKRFEHKGDYETANYLAKMDAHTDKLVDLVQNLLDVSRIQAGKFKFYEDVFDFDKLIKETIENLQIIAGKHKIVKKGSVKTLVLADKYRIEQVLTNLITNAIKYSPNASKVIIHISSDEDKIEVGIQDFGIGIPKKEQEKIFGRFYQVRKNRKTGFSGLGLGLYISNQIIKRHKGKFWLSSKYKQGSTFYFTLPITLHSRLVKNSFNIE